MRGSGATSNGSVEPYCVTAESAAVVSTRRTVDLGNCQAEQAGHERVVRGRVLLKRDKTEQQA